MSQEPGNDRNRESGPEKVARLRFRRGPGRSCRLPEGEWPRESSGERGGGIGPDDPVHTSGGAEGQTRMTWPGRAVVHSRPGSRSAATARWSLALCSRA